MIYWLLSLLDKSIRTLDENMYKLWDVWYKYNDWKCARFGHKMFVETKAAVPPHLACKRGCGPLNSDGTFAQRNITYVNIIE